MKLSIQDKAAERALEREAWHKLVVKIIIWKDGVQKVSDKITPKEWSRYCQGILKANISVGKEKIKNSLKETQNIIRNNGGFEA